MRYPPHVLDEIRARLPVSSVVGRRVKLRKAGREWKGLSPFNAEKSPSFFVNDQKAFYHCFSSGRHGDIFTFLMETEGLSFPEAVERLAGEAGVALPKEDRDDRIQEARRRSLHDVMEMAAVFFERSLRDRVGQRAREYLVRRGMSEDMQSTFRIGYAPGERYALRDYLAGQGVTPEAMAEAGLLVTGEDVRVPYDRFRDRVIFPICDLRGRVIAFGGRAMSADVPAKYLNSPDTPLFNKGRLLYNAHRARQPAHERGTVVAVEGYMDVIAMAACGFGHVVAPLGTALTEEQLGLLWRMADEPILCFDGDGAGRRAAYRAVDLVLPALAPGKSVRFALLPEGQDPDDLARSGGAAAIERVLSGARPLVDLLWSREVESGSLETPDKRAALEQRLREAVGAIKDETVKRHYRQEIENRLRSIAGPSRGAGGGARGGFSRGGGGERFGASAGGSKGAVRVSALLASSPLFTGATAESPREAMILAALIRHPERLFAHAETLSELPLEGRIAQLIRRTLLDCAADGEGLDGEIVAARLARAGFEHDVERLVSRIRPGDRWVLDPHADPMRLEDALRQAITLHRRAHTLHSELRAAERALAEDESETNLAWLRDVQIELSSLAGAEADLDNGLATGNP